MHACQKQQNTAALQNVAAVGRAHYVLCIVECGAAAPLSEPM